MRKLLALASTVLLCSCATYNLTLMPRDGGQMATGTVNKQDKTLTINLAGKVYHGPYTYMRSGSVGFGNAYGTASGVGGIATASAWGSSFAMSSMATGSAFLQAPDGSGLRCRFQFSTASQQGIGECMTDQKQIYDMQITTSH